MLASVCHAAATQRHVKGPEMQTETTSTGMRSDGVSRVLGTVGVAHPVITPEQVVLYLADESA